MIVFQEILLLCLKIIHLYLLYPSPTSQEIVYYIVLLIPFLDHMLLLSFLEDHTYYLQEILIHSLLQILVRIIILVYIKHPVFNMIKGISISNIINKNNCLCSFIITSCNSSKSFLTCGIPLCYVNIQFEVLHSDHREQYFLI